MLISHVTVVLSRPRRSKISIEAECQIPDASEIVQKPEIIKVAMTVLKSIWFPNPVKTSNLSIAYGPENRAQVVLEPSVVAPFNVQRNAAKTCAAKGYKFNGHVDG